MIDTSIHKVKSIQITDAVEWDGVELGAEPYQTREIIIQLANGTKYRINAFSAGEQIEIIKGKRT